MQRPPWARPELLGFKNPKTKGWRLLLAAGGVLRNDGLYWMARQTSMKNISARVRALWQNQNTGSLIPRKSFIAQQLSGASEKKRGRV